MPSWRARAIGCLTILLWCDSRAAALNPALAVRQYSHAAWRIRDGDFSSQISSIAQTPDGYLWLGTEGGLLRFDGVRAMLWQPPEGGPLPSTNISKLFVGADGRLWIGTSAGLGSVKDGRLVTYPQLAGVTIASLAEDSQRTVWAGTIEVPHGRVCAIRATVECLGQDGQFGVGVFSLLGDAGSLWVGAASGLWRWTSGELTRHATASHVRDLVDLGDGRLVIATPDGLRQLAGERLDPYLSRAFQRPMRPFRLLADRDGAVWIGTSAGLVHVHDGETDLFTRSDGLSGDIVREVFEDREGNLWVATNEGLDRFRELAVTTLPGGRGFPTDLISSIVRTRDDSIWIGTADGLRRWKDGRATIYRAREGLPDNRIGTMFEDSAGRLFVGTLRGIAVFDGGKFTPLRSVATRVVYGIVEERPGEFWISDQEHGLMHLVGETVVARIPWSGLGRGDHATAIVADRMRQGLWLGFYNGGVMFVKDGKPGASFGGGDGLGGGRVSQLRFDGQGALWAATAAGLSRINDGSVRTLTTGSGLPCDAVHWAIPDVDHSLWLSMSCGLVRIRPEELAAWTAGANRSVKATLLDGSDGVMTTAIPIGFSPPAANLPDGRLWFATATGVSAVDPRHLPFNTLVPAVHIEEVAVDRKIYPTTLSSSADAASSGALRLPALTRDLQIDYTALSLVAPEKVRFRYKLENHDRDWQDAGTRRQAFYNDLRPGRYRFRVTASNNSGVWNEAGASVDFSVAPAYYQTRWFLALAAGALFALVWAAHRVRLGIVERHQREITALNERLMRAQEQERIRIAGELHDGVMQQMLAVTMMLGTAKRKIVGDSAAKAAIDKVQDKLIEVGTEIRQLSHDLHPPMLQEAGLPQALHTYCDEFSSSCGIPVSCEADDEARELSRGSALALFRIVQEALGNAAKHAAARRISVRLRRSDGLVSLEVSDDGVGFDRTRLGSPGGLGLITMRERAGQLNGRFEVASASGRGTTISVTIPFR
jgi:signal transduction histidine kinase/ligand-binding sensor domain-containing protein